MTCIVGPISRCWLAAGAVSAELGAEANGVASDETQWGLTRYLRRLIDADVADDNTRLADRDPADALAALQDMLVELSYFRTTRWVTFEHAKRRQFIG
jgi:hypothetical protein